MIEPDAEAVNVRDRLVLLENGSTVPIDTLIDAWGDETDDEGLARTAICPLPDGKWMAVDLTLFTWGKVH